MTEPNPITNIEMKIEPIKFWNSILYFFAATILMVTMYYILFPRWVGRFGIVNGYFFSFIAGLMTLLFAAFALFYYESDNSHPATWKRFIERFHIKKLTKHDWKWILITLIPLFPLAIGMGVLNDYLISALNIDIPIPGDFEAAANAELVSPTIFQVIMMVIVLLVNIFAEELFFRGYLYPRQELVHEKWTWLIHGLLWWVFHAYKWFRLPTILFNSFLIPLLWQKTKNTTATIVSHFIVNSTSIAIGYILLLFT